MLQLVKKIILIFLILPSVIYGWFGNPQGSWDPHSAGATGILYCENKAFKGAIIRLYDYQDGTPRYLNTTFSDKNGFFEISGTHKTPYTIVPYVYISHDCRKRIPGCHYEFYEKIPENFVRMSEDGRPYYYLGIMKLGKKEYKTKRFNCHHTILK